MIFVIVFTLLTLWKWVVCEQRYFKLHYIEFGGDSAILSWPLPRNFLAEICLKNDLTGLSHYFIKETLDAYVLQ